MSNEFREKENETNFREGDGEIKFKKDGIEKKFRRGDYERKFRRGNGLIVRLDNTMKGMLNWVRLHYVWQE